MRDYKWYPKDGEPISIAQIPTETIYRLLNKRINYTGEISNPRVKERLELELFIRENNLRG